jgi:hypothetical protein
MEFGLQMHDAYHIESERAMLLERPIYSFEGVEMLPYRAGSFRRDLRRQRKRNRNLGDILANVEQADQVTRPNLPDVPVQTGQLYDIQRRLQEAGPLFFGPIGYGLSREMIRIKLQEFENGTEEPVAVDYDRIDLVHKLHPVFNELGNGVRSVLKAYDKRVETEGISFLLIDALHPNGALQDHTYLLRRVGGGNPRPHEMIKGFALILFG